MGALLACPFCRQLFPRAEAKSCPDCDLPLIALEKLPPSPREELDLPDSSPDGRFGAWFLGRGRGGLVGLSLVGGWLFTQPWVRLSGVETAVLSAYDLARTGVTWLFGGAVAWFLLVPLVLSRRSVSELRSIRIPVVTGALMTSVEALMLLLVPPSPHPLLSTEIDYAWGLHAALFHSLLTAAVATRLGGSLEDLRDLPPQSPRGARGPADPIH